MTNRKKPRIDAPTFVLHWAMVAVLTVSFLTGMRIASDYTASLAGVWARHLLGVLPQGRVVEFHVLSSWLVVLLAATYALYLLRSRQTARVKFRLSDFHAARRARTSVRLASDVARWHALNRMVFVLAFVLIGLLTVTGWMLYRGVSLGLGPHWVQTLHGAAAWGLVAYVLVHIAAVFKVGTFLKAFRPRPRHGATAAIAAVAAGAVIGGAYMVDRTAHPVLLVPRVEVAPVLDGTGADPAWGRADPVTIRTVRGANLPGGESSVGIRAVHDGSSIYFQFRWSDPQRSQKMTPLMKTEEGWRVLQSGLERNDENDYYEDKFAAIFSPRPALGSGTVHLGQDLVEGDHYRNPRGLHFSQDGSIVDLWHWKSVRSGGMTPGYIDDNYIGPLLPPVAAGTRYTGGYTQDPPGSPHPYLQNWTKVDPELSLDDTTILPRFLPRGPEVLDRMGRIDLDLSAHDEGTWYMTIDEVVPYDPALDHYPVGTVLPGIVLEGVFSGDRADVKAEAEWKDGYWTLEAQRLLDTGSPYDVAFSTDHAVYLWVAVFNHTQTRHSQHLHPVRIALE